MKPQQFSVAWLVFLAATWGWAVAWAMWCACCHAQPAPKRSAEILQFPVKAKRVNDAA